MMTLVSMTTTRAVGAPRPFARARASRTSRAVTKSRVTTDSQQRGVTCRVVQDPMSSLDMDVSGSVDVDQDARRRAVERDTAEKLREEIARMGGAPIQDPREFISTDKQRMYTFGLFASCAALGLRGVTGVAIDDGGDPLAYGSLLASCAMAYWLSDLGTGVFHWSVDNYGSKATPVMGGIIDAFQGHHKYPWTITKRQFANNIHTTCPATMCVTVPLLLAPGMSPQACVFMGTFCSLSVLSQQFHCWSHMKKSELPEAVIAAQDLGLLISRKGHGAHHKPPFKGNYCIVSGWWNDALDNGGFFTRMEKSIYAATGVAPRCWSDNDEFAIQEEAPEGWGEGIL